MTHDAVRDRFIDLLIGSLDEAEEADVRRHLRGCGACRRELVAMEEGLAVFARAVHTVEPPPETRERVLTALAEEWREAPAERRRPRFHRPIAVAASIVIALVGVAWGFGAQRNAHRLSLAVAKYEADHQRYASFLKALGGKEVRVGRLAPVGASLMQGSAVVYDGEAGQSWALVIVEGADPAEKLVAFLSGTHGSVRLGEVHVDSDGDGAGWLVTRTDLTGLDAIRLTSRSGAVIATGVMR